MEEALIKLIESGVPLAKWAIAWYYIYWTMCAILTCGTVLVIFTGIIRLLKRLVDNKIELDRKDYR